MPNVKQKTENNSYKKSIVFNYYLSIFSIPIPFLAIWLIPYMVYRLTKLGNMNSNSLEKIHYQNILISITYYWTCFLLMNLLYGYFEQLGGFVLFSFFLFLIIFMFRMLNGLNALYCGLTIKGMLNPFTLGKA